MLYSSHAVRVISVDNPRRDDDHCTQSNRVDAGDAVTASCIARGPTHPVSLNVAPSCAVSMARVLLRRCWTQP